MLSMDNKIMKTTTKKLLNNKMFICIMWWKNMRRINDFCIEYLTTRRGENALINIHDV